MSLSAAASFAYAIDPASRLAVVRLSGTVTGEDMRQIVATVHDDPRWSPTFDAIWDCSRVDAHVVSPSEVGPLVTEVVEGELGRDVMVKSHGLADQAISELLALLCRRAGKDVVTCATLQEGLGLIGREALPDALRDAATSPEP